VAEISYFLASEPHQLEMWALKSEFYKLYRNSIPNPAHVLFGELHKRNKLKKLITQVNNLKDPAINQTRISIISTKKEVFLSPTY
jgi:NAD-dependent SIR2 family protein deacetylase